MLCKALTLLARQQVIFLKNGFGRLVMDTILL